MGAEKSKKEIHVQYFAVETEIVRTYNLKITSLPDSRWKVGAFGTIKHSPEDILQHLGHMLSGAYTGKNAVHENGYVSNDPSIRKLNDNEEMILLKALKGE